MRDDGDADGDGDGDGGDAMTTHDGRRGSFPVYRCPRATTVATADAR